MKKNKLLILFCAIVTGLALTGCATQPQVPPGEHEGDGTPETGSVEPVTSALTSDAEAVIDTEIVSPVSIPDGATEITGAITISAAGDYYINTSIEGNKINVESDNVHLYLDGATLSNTKKVIESSFGLTITLLGTNSVSNSKTDGSNAIDCAGDLIVNGSGSLVVNSTKNGIKANSITVIDSSLTINSAKDGLHAEIDAYDDSEIEPDASYKDGGYVYLSGATVDITSVDDGIQADTFVYIEQSKVTVTAGGGAPDTVNEKTSENASGKGIKAGALDWGTAATDLDWDGYLVCIKSGTVMVNSNDDAIHSDGDTEICGGEVIVSSGDDGMHADNNLIISGGDIGVVKSYEGLEGTNIDVCGGEISVVAVDDGLNAAGGADNSGFGGGWTRPGAGGPPRAVSSSDTETPYINISGGKINIVSTADGLDSNGNLTVSGGEVYISGPINSMDVAIDYDGTAKILGGIVVAVSRYSNNMTQNFSSGSTQASVLLETSSMASGEVVLKDGSDKVLVSYTPTKSYNCVIISCPQLATGKSYKVSACGKTVTLTLSTLIYKKSF